MIQLSTVISHLLAHFRPSVAKSRCLIASVVLALTACAGPQQSLIYDTVKLGFANPNTTIEQTPLNPNYRYLKVDVNDLPALLVLGFLVFAVIRARRPVEEADPLSAAEEAALAQAVETDRLGHDPASGRPDDGR